MTSPVSHAKQIEHGNSQFVLLEVENCVEISHPIDTEEILNRLRFLRALKYLLVIFIVCGEPEFPSRFHKRKKSKILVFYGAYDIYEIDRKAFPRFELL